MTTQLSARKKLLFYLIMWVGVFVICAIPAKMIFQRVRAWAPNLTTRTAITPNVPFYHDDPELGFIANPGHYRFVEKDAGVPGELAYNVNIESDGSRSTGKKNEADYSKPEIWIFGCSFTWGQGLSDQETYPAVVQKYFPKFNVRNFGENGYGTVQSLIQLKRLIAKGKKPAAIVIGYIPFHMARNVGERNYVQALYWFSAFQRGLFYTFRESLEYKVKRLFLGRERSAAMANFHFPQAYLDSNGKNLQIRSIPLLPEIEDTEDHRRIEITEAVFDQIYERSEKLGVKPIILQLWHSVGVEPLKDYFLKTGFLYDDAFVNYSDPKWNNLPWNNHPNSKGNELFARHLEKMLKQTLRSPN